VPVEWKREGDITKVTRVQKFRADIHGAHSLENLPLALFDAMRDFDVEEAEADKAAMEAARREAEG
jgi:hypothetical protein